MTRRQRARDRDALTLPAGEFERIATQVDGIQTDQAQQLDHPLAPRGGFGDRLGGVNLAFGMASALYRRERTGEPSVVDVSLLGTAVWTIASDMLSALQGNWRAPAPAAATGDAAAAIAFARAQVGEPYQYGASGPSSWDCSGLTMRAWQAGGKSLPHYSVAQYQQSTPITLAELQPGDLLFWGDGSASSIYHVAIYTGNGMMIHAPRPGRSVEEVSMYYWITPNYFARP